MRLLHTTVLLFVFNLCFTQNDFELVMWYLKCHEGLSLTSYQLKGDKPTIGWGKQSELSQVTLTKAQQLIYSHFEKDYRKAKKNYPDLKKRQHLVLAALMYHIGSIGKELDRKIKNDLPIAETWIKYNKRNGKIDESFLKRRVIEIDIYNGVNLIYYHNQFKECTCKHLEKA